MIVAAKADLAIAQGLSAVCAWCVHYWRGADQRQRCGQPCGGPTRGLAFPCYDGPRRGALAALCFVCGAEPTAAVQLPGGMLGVCAAHLATLRSLLARQPNVVVREREVAVFPGFGQADVAVDS